MNLIIDDITKTITKTRVFECALCNSKTHSITKCFGYRKSNIEKNNYLKFNTNELNKNEERYFCASGIIPYVCVRNKVYLLVLIERRNNQLGLNFIGGKRECVKINNVFRPETSYETALNELEEELGEILIDESKNMIVEEIKKCTIPNFAFWSANSKMCLYGIKLPSKYLTLLILNENNKSTTESQGFKWIRYNGLGYMENSNYDYYSLKLHYYSKNILNAMISLSSEHNLNNLFI